MADKVSDVHPGAGTREQDIQDVYENGQAHAKHYTEDYPEQASRAASAPPPSASEHDYEEVQQKQIGWHLIFLSYRMLDSQEDVRSRNQRPNDRARGQHKDGRHEASARYDDTAASCIAPSPAKHLYSSPKA